MPRNLLVYLPLLYHSVTAHREDQMSPPYYENYFELMNSLIKSMGLPRSPPSVFWEPLFKRLEMKLDFNTQPLDDGCLRIPQKPQVTTAGEGLPALQPKSEVLSALQSTHLPHRLLFTHHQNTIKQIIPPWINVPNLRVTTKWLLKIITNFISITTHTILSIKSLSLLLFGLLEKAFFHCEALAVLELKRSSCLCLSNDGWRTVPSHESSPDLCRIHSIMCVQCLKNELSTPHSGHIITLGTGNPGNTGSLSYADFQMLNHFLTEYCLFIVVWHRVKS